MGLRRDGVRGRSLNSPGHAHFSEHRGPGIGRAPELCYGSFRGDKSVGFLARGSAGRSDTGEGRLRSAGVSLAEYGLGWSGDLPGPVAASAP